jgi:hypothetical protein
MFKTFSSNLKRGKGFFMLFKESFITYLKAIAVYLLICMKKG